MAFNGSGTYNLPSADLPVSGQLVSSTKMNSILSDLATALSLCLARDGQSTMNGTLLMGSQKITGLSDGAVGAPAAAFANSTTTGLYSSAANKAAIAANGVKSAEFEETGATMNLLAASTIESLKIGFRNLPSISSTGETIAVAGVGKTYKTTGNMTVPNSTFADDDVVSIYNNSASAITITASVGTLRFAGTTSTGNRTLAARGFCTVWFVSATEAIITGSGLT